jgi:tRNA acetyltransferase TAN1
LNLIITCARHLEPETKEEISRLLEKFGDSESQVVITDMSGILTAKTKLEPVEVIRKLNQIIEDEPWSVRYCLRIIPIQKLTNTNINEIEEAVEKIIDQIMEGESYRISIEKRNSNISSKELITKIANKVKNKVSLENPDKVIQVEILGGKTGISVLKRSDILSVEKTKRRLSE